MGSDNTVILTVKRKKLYAGRPKSQTKIRTTVCTKEEIESKAIGGSTKDKMLSGNKISINPCSANLRILTNVTIIITICTP